jgi:hypothetical protein
MANGVPLHAADPDGWGVGLLKQASYDAAEFAICHDESWVRGNGDKGEGLSSCSVQHCSDGAGGGGNDERANVSFHVCTPRLRGTSHDDLEVPDGY